MLNMKKGCKIKNPDKLYEQYEKTDNGYIANINAEKIIDVINEFVFAQEEPVFFFLELPAKLDEEKKIRENGTAKAFHKNVYYMDNLTKEDVSVFLGNVGDLLVNDGLCTFGFGSQICQDEIAVKKYNVVTIYSENNTSYEMLFDKFEISKTDRLITAWDTFSEESPGHSERYDVDGKNVYSIIDDYKDWGIYFAEQREDI